MKYKVLLRPTLTIVLAFIGALVARVVTPPAIFAETGTIFVLTAAAAFGLFGFILPELVELAGRAGIAVLAKQIASHLPETPSVSVGALSFGKRSGRKKVSSKYMNPMVIDTSALIDGRLVDITKTGFLFGTFLVIPAVVGELHTLSDSADDLKRARGRRGLEVLSELKKNKKVKVEVLSSDPNEEKVDDKLVNLAKKVRGKLVTVDYNLNKVATVKGVDSLNLNELANAVKTVVLPNESMTVTINAQGKEKNQGVGYLPDGTMVVVEGGAIYKGRDVTVKVLRVLQTAAGKMIFGKPDRL
ncbi:MAG: hypothetical protein NUV69_01020 [Candidatus Curtissbacteria bacterium]|nr:hypothetical protein [Candidatus Curtissbacteria bacterium]